MEGSQARRTLRFENLADVAEEVRRLERVGCDRVGRWDLGQVCRHLNEWLSYSMDGFPRPPLVVGLILTAVRSTMGPSMLRDIIRKGEMKAGFSTDPKTVFPAGGDHQAAVEALVATCARLDSWTGPIHPSPLFGPMDKATVIKLQLAHAALHLSFLIPRA